MADAWGMDDIHSSESEIERLKRQIREADKRIKVKQAYLAFLEANPLFVKYQNLKQEAN